MIIEVLHATVISEAMIVFNAGVKPSLSIVAISTKTEMTLIVAKDLVSATSRIDVETAKTGETNMILAKHKLRTLDNSTNNLQWAEYRAIHLLHLLVLAPV